MTTKTTTVLLLALALFAPRLKAQTNITVTVRPQTVSAPATALTIPAGSVPMTINGFTFQVPIPALTATKTNVVNMVVWTTNVINMVVWTTNVVNMVVWSTNSYNVTNTWTPPVYLSSLVVTGALNVPGGINIKTNL